ncbi:unnamed protein product [Phaeothamnion confervicola]
MRNCRRRLQLPVARQHGVGRHPDERGVAAAVPVLVLRGEHGGQGVVPLAALALCVRECCDMAIYWLPQMLSNVFNVVQFVEQRHDETPARFRISPRPEITFRGMPAYDTSLDAVGLNGAGAPRFCVREVDREEVAEGRNPPEG